jgi:hypothetical protein
MVSSLNCITISEASRRSGTRCGWYSTTSRVTLPMAQHQPRDFSGGRFPRSLKPCYPLSRACLDLGNENTRWR